MTKGAKHLFKHFPEKETEKTQNIWKDTQVH